MTKSIHIKLLNVRFGMIRIYSPYETPFTLKHLLYFLDPFYPVHDFQSVHEHLRGFVSYRPSKRVYLLGNKTYSDFDRYVTIAGIPPGNHVLTLVTPRTNETFVTTISHIVVF